MQVQGAGATSAQNDNNTARREDKFPYSAKAENSARRAQDSRRAFENQAPNWAGQNQTKQQGNSQSPAARDAATPDTAASNAARQTTEAQDLGGTGGNDANAGKAAAETSQSPGSDSPEQEPPEMILRETRSEFANARIENDFSSATAEKTNGAEQRNAAADMAKNGAADKKIAKKDKMNGAGDKKAAAENSMNSAGDASSGPDDKKIAQKEKMNDAADEKVGTDAAAAANGVNDVSTLGDSQDPGDQILDAQKGSDALTSALEKRGVDVDTLTQQSKDIISNYGQTIDNINEAEPKTAEDLNDAVVDGADIKFEAVEDLKDDNGNALRGFAGKDGTVLINKAQETDPDGVEGMQSVAVNEVGERAFQDIAKAEKDAGKQLATATEDGLSEGDFGAEVAVRNRGGSTENLLSSLREGQHSDEVSVNGQSGESLLLLPHHIAAPATVIGLVVNFFINHALGPVADYPLDKRPKIRAEGIVSGPSMASSHHNAFYAAEQARGAIKKGFEATLSEAKAKGHGDWSKSSAYHNDLKKGFFRDIWPTGYKNNHGWSMEFKSVYEPPYKGVGNSNAGLGSDRRIKQDIKVVDFDKKLGVQLYSWRYRNDDPTRYVGVMAQDLLARPDLAHAVHTAKRGEFAGFYAVDYAAIGMRMKSEADWVRT